MNKNLNYILLLSFVFCLLSFTLSAQGTVKGVVLGDDQPDGLISATVVVGENGTVTEYDGSFELSLPAGEHTINISYTGYDTYKETFTLSDGEIKEINITLLQAATMLETATVTSGKFEKPLGEVTVSLEVIKPAFAEATNSTTVDQVLDRVPGVTIVDGQANIRGGSGFSYGAGSRVLLLVDDIPILSGDAGFPNWNDVPVENIEQMEVVKGAASALYGSSALNGIINIRTAYAKNKPETQVAVFRDMFSAPKDEAKKWWEPDSIAAPYKMGASIIHRRKMGKLDMVLGMNGYREKRYTQNAWDNRFRFNTKFRYRFNENLNAGFFTNFNVGNSSTVFLWENGEEGAYVGGTLGGLTTSKVRRYNIDPFVTYYDKFGNKHRYIGRFYSTNNDNNNDQSNFSDNFYNEYQFQRKFEKIGLVLTTGVVGQNSNVEGSLYGDFQYKSANIATYAQLEKKFYLSKDEKGERVENRNVLNLTLGARYEFNSLIGPDTVYYNPDDFLVNPNSPFEVIDGSVTESKPVFRVGMSYQASDYTFLRASWGQGYRFPTIAEKYIFTQVSILNIFPNPLLTSETGWSAEFGVKQGYKVGIFDGFVDVSAFWSKYSNMMEFNLSEIPGIVLPGFQSNNVGGTDIKGMEISIAGRSNTSGKVALNYLLGYTFINPKFQEFEEVAYPSPDGIPDTQAEQNGYFSTADFNILKYRNRHTFKMDVEATYDETYSLGVSLNGASKVEAIDEPLAALSGIGQYYDANNTAYGIFDLRVGYKPIEQLKLTLVAKNLANKEYASRPGLLQPMRSFSVRLDAWF